MSNPVSLYKDFGYKVSSNFGGRDDPFGKGSESHKGIDLVAPKGSGVSAFVPGKVVFAGEGKPGTGLGGYGNVVVVQDKNGVMHVYGHMNNVTVKKGDTVSQGSKLGGQGSSGKSTGDHLHYEVRADGKGGSYGYGSHTDPNKYISSYYGRG